MSCQGIYKRNNSCCDHLCLIYRKPMLWSWEHYLIPLHLDLAYSCLHKTGSVWKSWKAKIHPFQCGVCMTIPKFKGKAGFLHFLIPLTQKKGSSGDRNLGKMIEKNKSKNKSWNSIYKLLVWQYSNHQFDGFWYREVKTVLFIPHLQHT